jgi:hypothetical protein
MEDTAGWLTEEQLIAETGIGRFTLDRRRRQGLVPWARRFLGIGVGTRTVYPPIAVPMLRRLQELQQAFKGVDRWRWALWLEGHPVDIIKWHDRDLDTGVAGLDRRACAHVPLFGGAPKLLVPDNLKSGVNKACFYDPEINRTYGAMAAYSVGILPARPRWPRDKAKASYCTLSRWRRRDAQDPSCARLAASAFRGDCEV